MSRDEATHKKKMERKTKEQKKAGPQIRTKKDKGKPDKTRKEETSSEANQKKRKNAGPGEQNKLLTSSRDEYPRKQKHMRSKTQKISSEGSLENRKQPSTIPRLEMNKTLPTAGKANRPGQIEE